MLDFGKDLERIHNKGEGHCLFQAQGRDPMQLEKKFTYFRENPDG